MSVLIVGAGPVGLTLACVLAQRGVIARVIDQKGGRVPESRATDVHARTLELLASLGLAEALIARGEQARGATFYAKGEVLARFETGALESPFPLILGVPQHVTEALLEERLEALGGRVEREVTLERLEARADGVVAGLRGPRGEAEAAEVAWLVGCDGANSAVRRLLGLSFEGVSYEEPFLLADLAVDWALPTDQLHLFFSPEGFFMVLPMPGEGQVRVFADEGAATGAAPTLEVFQAMASARVHVPARLHSPGWMSRFRVHRRMVERYRHGRIFLAGDAAHIHSPIGGQGMNMGVQDAFNLGWKLAAVEKGEAGEGLLDSYQAERHPIAASVLLKTHVATLMSTARQPWLRELRDRTSGWIMGLPGVQQWVAGMTAALDYELGSSPLVAAAQGSLWAAAASGWHPEKDEAAGVREWMEFSAGPQPGARVPSRWFGGAEARRHSHSLVTLRRHRVLLFDGAAATEAGYHHLRRVAEDLEARFGEAVEAWVVIPHGVAPEELRGMEHVLLDPQGELHCSFGARAECAYALRPDGYIGFRSQPAGLEELTRFLHDTSFYA